jgi:hypothetical protein
MKHLLSLKMRCFYLLLFVSVNSFADVYIRHNQVGYSPERSKRIIVMADESMQGMAWKLVDKDKVEQSSGVMVNSIAGTTSHTAKPFNYLIDISDITTVGTYELSVAEQKVSIVIADKPYQYLLSKILRFLRVNRSGTDDTLLTPASHLGDQSLLLYRPYGDTELGQWQVDNQAEKVDMLGGWYDAADYIKFTLTTAYTSYYLLRSYQEAPELFTKELSHSDLIDVLDEAKIGLDYLLKTFPSQNEFIIQVSSGKDHQEGFRLPQNDLRDGKREAFSAISSAHMGLTSAALALGSDIFSQQNKATLALKYREAAIAIYQRAREDDAINTSVFERNATNDFYRDNDSNDNMGLAAAELYRLTHEEQYLTHAKEYVALAGASNWTAWCCVTSSLNYRLSEWSETASLQLTEELSAYQTYAQPDNIWGIPMKPTWGPLLGAHVVASYAGLHYLSDNQYSAQMLWDNVDYFLGRNNWGVSFIASPELLKPATHVYSQVYKLTNEYPLGAVSEGPGSKTSYLSLKSYFTETELDSSFEPFNTSTQVFYDNASNFQTMESTIAAQATTLYMLAVASKVKSSTEVFIQVTKSEAPTQSTEDNSVKKTSSGGMNSLLINLFLVLVLIIRIRIKKLHKAIIKRNHCEN